MLNRIVIVRHGEALDASSDEKRPLSSYGVDQIKHQAQQTKKCGIKVERIWHSHKKRAEQTAEIFAREFDLTDFCMAKEGLSPNDEAEPILDLALEEKGELMLVSHLPLVGIIASLLIGDVSNLAFHTGTVCDIVKSNGIWEISNVLHRE